MKLATIKSAKETGIDGISFIYTDKAVTEIIIGKLHIRKGESYSTALQVLVEVEGEKVTRYELTAIIEGFPPAVSLHESEYDAKVMGTALENRGAEISIKVVQVVEDDDGNVLSQEAAEPITDDLPF